MGTMITLSLGCLEVDWGKNDYFKDHRAIYQEKDLKDIPTYLPGQDWPDGDPIVEMNEGFGKPLRHVKDRVELLGFTLKSIEDH